MSKRYYERALKGTGTSGTEFFSNFGASILKKFGWTEGTSLGKSNTGLKTCIQVEKREERVGLGASTKNDSNPWENWWDDLYNKTIKKVELESGLSEQKVDEKISQHKSKSRTLQPLQSNRQKGKLLRIQKSEKLLHNTQPTVTLTCDTTALLKNKKKKSKKHKLKKHSQSILSSSKKIKKTT